MSGAPVSVAPRIDHGAPATSARGAAASLALLFGINLFNYIDRNVLAATEDAIRAQFFEPGDRTAQFWTGLLGTAFMVSYMITAPVFGWMADRSRRWVIIGIGVTLWSLASGGSGLALTFAMLLATRIFVGIGEGAYGPAAPPLIADLYPIQRRGRALSWFYLAMPVGSAIGLGVGGYIAHRLGWRWAFYLVVPWGVVLGGLCLVMKEPRRGQAEHSAAKRTARLADYLSLARTPSYVWNTAGMTLMTFAIGGVSFWMPTYIADFRHQGAQGKLVFGMVTAAGGLVGTFLGGSLGDRLRPRWSGSYFLVAGVGILLAFPLFLVVMAAPFPWAWPVMFLAVLLLFLGTGPTNVILANVTHPAVRASAFALTIFIVHLLGDAISPPLIGWLNGRSASESHPLPLGNMNVGFTVVSLAMLGAGVAWCIGSRHLAQDTELAPTRLDQVG